jgi:heme/copper-type cytochrome/quinol oxidase subunit 3
MSIDTHSEPDAHEAHDGGHHEPREVVDGRQRLGVWLFIGGDMITLSALLFVYLYLRGVNTDGHWMSMLGYQGHTYGWYENALNSSAGLPAPTMIHVGPVSAGFFWLVTLVTALSASIIWAAERGLRATKNAKAYSNLAALATLVTVVGIVLAIIQLRQLPQIFVANNDSQVMAYTSYSSAMMLIEGAAVVHLFVLAFLGLGLSIRSARGVISGENWFQARLVRIFWVWVGISGIIGAAVVTTVNTIH